MLIQWPASIHCQYRDIWYLWCACICVLVCILCLSYVLRSMQSALVVDLFYLTLNVTIYIVCLHFSSFCCLSSEADFSNTEARAPNSAGRTPFLPVRRPMQFIYVVWVGHGHCYGDISYHTPKMDSSNLNIFAELSPLGGDHFSFLTKHLTEGLQAKHG